MSPPPEYFERIREDASNWLDQLERNPKNAGPWHLLFKQVQSPRHILSELLQNADDAGASSASVQIENGVFIFRHNGNDFIDDHFESLCNFGYSNKRILHTIGFRGIGFKSTFSLGDRVELYTPTLSVAFDSRRFTEPMWLDTPLRNDGLTEVRIEIKDEERQDLVEKNLKEWCYSPISLLFFKNIRHLTIQDDEVQWRTIGPGPVKDTKWVELVNGDDKPYLIAKSTFESFPNDALTEIKQERMLSMDEDAEFPPCQVEIVLGANGRLFVVLPTEVETSLPFVCNAPFIQDPERSKIKDPGMSPTNRWLLKRIGRLAASVMLQWLGDNDISLAERSKAYDLLPEIESNNHSLEGICAATVIKDFDETITNQDYLLTDAGDLKLPNQSITIPNEIIEIWPIKQVASLLDDSKRPALTHHISETNKRKLIDREVIEEITKIQIWLTLRNKQLPKPENWYKLLNLWAYIASESDGSNLGLNIVPIKGKDRLYAAKDVVRLGKEKILQSDEDWDFLSEYLLVLNNDFVRFISEQPQGLEAELRKKINITRAILKTMELDTSNKTTRIIDVAATQFFGRDEVFISECVQFAQIAAKLGANIGNSFRYVTEDNQHRSIKDIVLFDDDNLEQILPKDWSRKHLLHSCYYNDFKYCTKDDWISWISSKHTGISTFVPIKQKNEFVYRRKNIEHEMHIRGFKGEPSYHYKTDTFIIIDWDFDKEHWVYWNNLAKENNKIWVRIVKCILSQNASFWSKTINARILQKSKQDTRKKITSDPLLPAWILKLRELPCIPDTNGFPRKPSEIFRLTPETGSLMGVEPFIDSRYDTESTRPLLILLGVCDTPTGPDRLLDRLRALSKAANPPIEEVNKWYRQLDIMLNSCSTEDSKKVKQVFNNESIIFTESGKWRRLSKVFLFSDEEDFPGAEIIRLSVRDLAIWRKLGINEKPTADLVIQWLNDLPTGQMVTKDDLPIVRRILPSHASRIWNECGHWLNLAGEWIPVENIEYSISMQSLIPWSHLHGWVKQKTADFKRLSGELLQISPFSEVSTLANQIDNRFHHEPSFINSPVKREWLNCFGENICRIELDDEENTSRIRSLAADLAETMWQETPGLETIPYINGKPAGTPTNVNIMWLDKILYFDDIPNAKLARQVPDNLGKLFNHPAITAALNYCFGRTLRDVTEYLEENFNLMPIEEIEPSAIDDNVTEGSVIPQEETDENAQKNNVSVCNNELPQEVCCDDTQVVTSESENDNGGDFEMTGKEQVETQETDVEITKIRHPPKPTKQGIMERFALSQGYQKKEGNHFIHPDGNRIHKSDNGNIFPWMKLSSTGEVICEYWPKDHCLQHAPLEIEAEVWGMIDKSPDTCAFILSDTEDKPIELPGERLRSMCDEGKITLYPATYRISYDNGN